MVYGIEYEETTLQKYCITEELSQFLFPVSIEIVFSK